MNYPETIDYLYSRLPMFTRVGISAFKKDLTNTLALCEKLGNPQDRIRTIHVGGTNGKGSTSHMLAAVLQTAGYRTGLYTSPHLRDFRERIRVNGTMIPKEQVVRFVESQSKNIEKIQPSFFEVTVAMAFDHFAAEQVDIAVIEVGLGGRLDSTNVITPLLSVITNIGYDHMNLLGDTLPEIAAEKAGIIKPGVPVIIGEKQEPVSGVFLDKAKETGSSIEFASESWEVLVQDAPAPDGLLHLSAARVKGNAAPLPLALDLTGSYQLKNIQTVLSSVDALRRSGFDISDEQLSRALKQVQSLTGLAGRWQTIGTDPLIICDTGHNAEGIREVVQNIRNTPWRKLHMVIGMVRDKDSGKVLSLLPRNAAYYFCQPAVERGKPAADLAREAAEAGLHGTAYPTVAEALGAAKAAAAPGDLIFVGGSTFVVAEVV